jgi:hypothetical protein
MTTLQRLESSDPRTAGIALTFPSGACKAIQWTTDKPISPTLDAAKEYAAVVLDALMREGRIDDAERTNWASCTAAIKKHLEDFNDALGKTSGNRRATPATVVPS